MLRRSFLTVTTCIFMTASCSGEPATPQETPGEGTPQHNLRFSVFHVDSLLEALPAADRTFLQFLDDGALRAGIYHLAAGAIDTQEPHTEDEIYYVLSGQAMLDAGGVSYTVQPGNVHFVKAGISHMFRDITEDLDLIVVFSDTPSSTGGVNAQTFALDEIVAGRNLSENVWNPFLQLTTMTFGMYMLPRSVGGDNDLTHTVDEINIMVNGSGTFTVDGEDVGIRSGSIMFVERGAPHRFRNLTDDVDVLILWSGA